MQAQGFLAESFVDVNSYGQRHFLLVQRNAAGRIDALVTTSGGRDTPDSMLGRMVGFLGAAGGYVPNNPANGDEGRILGAYGGWRSMVSDWGPVETRPSEGHAAFVLALGNPSQFSESLFRNNIGVPEANRMNTDLDMNGNEITNLAQISGSQTLEIKTDLWSRENAVLEKNVRIGEDLDVLGDLAVAKDIVSGQNITAELDLKAKHNLSVDNVTSTNMLEVRTDASVEGTASVERIVSKETNIDTIVIDPTGRHSTSAEIKLTDYLPRMVFQYSYHVSRSQNLVYKPTCAGGYANARIQVNPVTVASGSHSSAELDENSNGGLGAVNPEALSVADHSDSIWKVVWTGNSGSGGSAVANTYCFYD